MSANSAARNSNGTADEKNAIDRAHALCAEALKICDALELSPDIGARLEDVITALEESSNQRRS